MKHVTLFCLINSFNEYFFKTIIAKYFFKLEMIFSYTFYMHQECQSFENGLEYCPDKLQGFHFQPLDVFNKCCIQDTNLQIVRKPLSTVLLNTIFCYYTIKVDIYLMDIFVTSECLFCLVFFHFSIKDIRYIIRYVYLEKDFKNIVRLFIILIIIQKA